jgi:hypothetical protein
MGFPTVGWIWRRVGIMRSGKLRVCCDYLCYYMLKAAAFRKQFSRRAIPLHLVIEITIVSPIEYMATMACRACATCIPALPKEAIS